jgi:hypothetical protein
MEMLILLAFFSGGVLVILHGTLKKTKWGINFHPSKICPICGTPFPKFLRRPQNSAQALWGGNTCSNCEAHFDKWGHYIGGDDSHLYD